MNHVLHFQRNSDLCQYFSLQVDRPTLRPSRLDPQHCALTISAVNHLFADGSAAERWPMGCSSFLTAMCARQGQRRTKARQQMKHRKQISHARNDISDSRVSLNKPLVFVCFRSVRRNVHARVLDVELSKFLDDYISNSCMLNMQYAFGRKNT